MGLVLAGLLGFSFFLRAVSISDLNASQSIMALGATSASPICKLVKSVFDIKDARNVLLSGLLNGLQYADNLNCR